MFLAGENLTTRTFRALGYRSRIISGVGTQTRIELARYGQLILSEGGRPHTFTAVNEPSAGAAPWSAVTITT